MGFIKVIVGMSGGVDSSMTAYLLKKQGHDVQGISFVLYEMRGSKSIKACCSYEAIKSAEETARAIGISHKAIDLRDEFMELVIEPFIESYSKGLTPNPCILCNRYIKFPFLLRETEKVGAGFIATGHYAKVEDGLLKKGIDTKKDQSYVLYVLRDKELNSLLLPLGNFKKEDVRAMAKECGLYISGRPESQEVCFIGDKNYSGFLEGLIPQRKGPIFDMNGKVIGTHKGIYHYTLGQRKGLGISSKEPLYVTGLKPSENAIYVGQKELAFRKEFYVCDLNWLIPKKEDFRAGVKVRSMMPDKPANVYVISEERVKVIYDEPQWAPASGQSAVFYEGDVVVGGGVIEIE